MNDTRRSLREGCGNSLAVLKESSVAGGVPIPRLIVGYGSVQHSIARLSRVPEAFAFILQRAAQAREGLICCGEVKNG
jgi:hypothetical protein